MADYPKTSTGRNVHSESEYSCGQYVFVLQDFQRVGLELGIGFSTLYLSCTPNWTNDVVWYENNTQFVKRSLHQDSR